MLSRIFDIKQSNIFNRETGYVKRGLVCTQVKNFEGKQPGITQIAEKVDGTYFYTAKILQRRVKKGFIESQKGKGGGFILMTGNRICLSNN